MNYLTFAIIYVILIFIFGVVILRREQYYGEFELVVLSLFFPLYTGKLFVIEKISDLIDYLIEKNK
jgi:hypothetical protein